MKTLKFITLVFIGIFALLYLWYVSYVYFYQGEMVFIANKLDRNYSFQFDVDFEEVIIPSFDQTKLHGILFKTKNPKGVLFYLHGNKGALNSWGTISQTFTDLGYDIFILDYRGFGKSEGKNENQEQVYKDISIAYDVISSKYKEKEKIIVGYSIGTGLAAYLATIKDTNKLILLAPYFNFLELSSGRVPFFPDQLKKFRFETNTYIPKIKCLIYIFHGKNDLLINYQNSVRLYKIMKPNDSLVSLENQGHIGINENEDFKVKLKQILK